MQKNVTRNNIIIVLDLFSQVGSKGFEPLWIWAPLIINNIFVLLGLEIKYKFQLFHI